MTKVERCIEMLEAVGFRVHWCKPAKGHWRKKQADCYAWEFSATLNGCAVVGGCWETMTACVKAGRLAWDPKTKEVYPV